MKIRHAGGRSVGKTMRSIEWLRECWEKGLTTIMYCSGYELFNPFISKEYLEMLEERKRFGPEEFRKLLEGSWDTEEGEPYAD